MDMSPDAFHSDYFKQAAISFNDLLSYSNVSSWLIDYVFFFPVLHVLTLVPVEFRTL